jgi:AcrR family transcriptional regulator
VLSIVCNNHVMPAGSIRARVRAEMTSEIKAVARRHLETDGANLSLRAVARDMGMVSSALYRYFASRDELLTALILDAYNELGEVTEAADAAVFDRARLRSRWLAAAKAIRGWALRKPAEYALLFGSPVPGYAAPQDTIAAAARTPFVLIGILADGYGSGVLTAHPPLLATRPATPETPLLATTPAPPETLATTPATPPAGASGAGTPTTQPLTNAVRADLVRARDGIAPGLPEELMLAGMTSWIQLFGIVSFELFGQFNNVIDARDELFETQMELMASLMGLPPEQ